MALMGFPRNRPGCTWLPEVPEEEVADLAVGQGSVQQEFGQLAVQVGLVFEHLHQLQEVLEELAIPAEKESERPTAAKEVEEEAEARLTPTQHALLGAGGKAASWRSRESVHPRGSTQPAGLTSASAGT